MGSTCHYDAGNTAEYDVPASPGIKWIQYSRDIFFRSHRLSYEKLRAFIIADYDLLRRKYSPSIVRFVPDTDIVDKPDEAERTF